MQKSMIKFLSIADCISLINACFGFLAILILFSNFDFNIVRVSFSLILLALLADGLDGIVARKNRESNLGDYLEAMADMISMGIAPSVFVFYLYFDDISTDLIIQIILILVLVFFIICNMIRLSSFHLIKNKSFFIGIPASVSTIFIIIASFIRVNIEYILVLIFALSLLTISQIRFPKPKIKTNTIAVVLIILTLIIGELYYYIAPILLFFALTIYVIAGPIFARKALHDISKLNS